MPRDYDRHLRVGDQIQRIIAQVISNKIQDSRMTLVTVSEVRVSRDLRNATVYTTSLQENIDTMELEKVLNHAAGLFRNEIGRQLKIYSIPRLKFVFDKQLRDGMALHDLIERAVASDKDKKQDVHG
jgi:ribosome-binding factor A